MDPKQINANGYGPSFYERQLARLAEQARHERSTLAAMTVAVARMAARKEEPPNGLTKFCIMRFTAKGDEILPEYLSEIDGPSMPKGWSTFDQRQEWTGRLSAEQALVEFPDGAAVPPALAIQFSETSLTQSPAARGWDAGVSL